MPGWQPCLHVYRKHGDGEAAGGELFQVVQAQAQMKQTRFKLKAMLASSQSNFETGCFQAGVELAAPPSYQVVQLLDLSIRARPASLVVVGGASSYNKGSRVQVESTVILFRIKV